MNLNEYVLAQKDALLVTLQENIRIPSVEDKPEEGAPYGIEVRRSLDHVLAAAEKLGFPTVNLDGHVGWCEYGSGEEMVAVLGHLDVVPAGDGWTCDPYGGEIRDGNVWGRGTMDDKGPSIAALYALAALRDSGLPLKRRIRLLFGCNEETGAKDLKYYLAKGGEIPVMGFTPDAEYPVINGEKGIINATFTRKLNQSGPWKLLSIHGGTAANVVPDHASASIACSPEDAAQIAKTNIDHVHFTITEEGVLVEAEGVSAHGSTPGQGENAIGRLVLALDQLPFSGDAANTIHFLASAIGMETNGASAGIFLQDSVSGELTLNLGVLKLEADTLTMVINYRYPVTFAYEDCAPAFNKKMKDAGFMLDTETHKAKLYVPADSPLVKTLVDVYRSHTDYTDEPKSIGGGTYAKSLPNIVAFGPIFPGDEVREHKPDEFIAIDSLMKNAQIIASAMYELAK